MRTKVKNNSSAKNEYRPEFFDFFANRGRTVSLILKNENVRTGKLLCFCADSTIVLDVISKLGPVITEVPFFDVSDIIVLND